MEWICKNCILLQLEIGKIKFVIALFFVLLSNLKLLSESIDNDSWPGWRGNNFGSIETDKPPLQGAQNTNAHIVWKTSIDGEGHSSPITDGKLIYITSASKDKLIPLIDKLFSLLEIFLTVFLIFNTFRSISFHPDKKIKDILYFSLCISCLLWVLFILILGEAYFTFSRCDLRAWFISIVMYTFLMIYYFVHLRINRIKASKILFPTILLIHLLLFFCNYSALTR